MTGKHVRCVAMGKVVWRGALRDPLPPFFRLPLLPRYSAAVEDDALDSVPLLTNFRRTDEIAEGGPTGREVVYLWMP